MDAPKPSFLDIAEESLDLVGGLVTALLPLFLLSAPVLVPTALVAALVAAAFALVAVVLGTLLAGPLLLIRAVWRRRAGPAA